MAFYRGRGQFFFNITSCVQQLQHEPQETAAFQINSIITQKIFLPAQEGNEIYFMYYYNYVLYMYQLKRLYYIIYIIYTYIVRYCKIWILNLVLKYIANMLHGDFQHTKPMK